MGAPHVQWEAPEHLAQLLKPLAHLNSSLHTACGAGRRAPATPDLEGRGWKGSRAPCRPCRRHTRSTHLLVSDLNKRCV